MKEYDGSYYMTKYVDFFNSKTIFQGMTPIEVFKKTKEIEFEKLADYCVDFEYSMVKDYFLDDEEGLTEFCFIKGLEEDQKMELFSLDYEDPIIFLPSIIDYWYKQNKEASYSIIFLLFIAQIEFTDVETMVRAFESELKGEDW